MSSSTTHPRRTRASPSVTLLDSFQNMSIRKGDTFHVPHKGDQEIWDPLAQKPKTAATPSLPARSTTCPQSLEDLLLGSGERRTVDLLDRVDAAIATQSKLALATILSEPEVLPLPTLSEHQTHQSSASHSSDSGIGSSVASESGKAAETCDSSSTSKAMTAISAATEARGLSEYAKEQIHLHIIQPILREPSLQDFHNLIKEVPHRIGNKEIKTLRDLEKTLIFCAPDYSRTPRKYLEFCDRTIRVLHTTATTIHESEHRAPTDRPYSNLYFNSLIEQIRRYATILAATRERQVKGEKADDMDYSPDETVSLHGGLSHNGKPAELVRHKDGKVISLATGRTLSAEEVQPTNMKRSMPDIGVEDEEDVLRSMARRKKNAKPEIHECPQCDKEFKRPCDLTKHIKTHDRPYKCPNDKCKYHTFGWPTEKECERHVNDKHSSAPSLYHCLYKPCPYTSKRESNCKQHMEKAHNWQYVRSKNNGKGQPSDVARLPRGSVSQSPAPAMLTPITPIAPSPSASAHSWMSSRHSSMAPPATVPSHFGTPAIAQPSPDFPGHFNMDFDFNNAAQFDFNNVEKFPITPALSEDRRGSSSTSDSGLMFNDPNFLSPETFGFLPNFDFDINLHQTTSNTGIDNNTYHSHGHPSNAGSHIGSVEQQVSPGAPVDPTFTPDMYDNMTMDDGYGAGGDASGGDFTLFGTRPTTISNGGEMFPDLAERGGSWGNFGGQFDIKQEPVPMPTENSLLSELFPELNNAHPR